MSTVRIKQLDPEFLTKFGLSEEQADQLSDEEVARLDAAYPNGKDLSASETPKTARELYENWQSPNPLAFMQEMFKKSKESSTDSETDTDTTATKKKVKVKSSDDDEETADARLLKTKKLPTPKRRMEVIGGNPPSSIVAQNSDEEDDTGDDAETPKKLSPSKFKAAALYEFEPVGKDVRHDAAPFTENEAAIINNQTPSAYSSSLMDEPTPQPEEDIPAVKPISIKSPGADFEAGFAPKTTTLVGAQLPMENDKPFSGDWQGAYDAEKVSPKTPSLVGAQTPIAPATFSSDVQRTTEVPAVDAMGNITGAPAENPVVVDGDQTAVDLVKSMNHSLVVMAQMPSLVGHFSAFMYKPIDAAFGTNYTERAQAQWGSYMADVDRLGEVSGFTKEPSNLTERAFEALGMVLLPFKGAKIPAVGTMGGELKHFAKQLALPGTIIREGEAVFPTLATAGIASATFSEFAHQWLGHEKDLHGETSPVTSATPQQVNQIDALIQAYKEGDIKAIKASIGIPDWGLALLGVAGIVGLARGVTKTLAKDVPNRSMVNPTAGFGSANDTVSLTTAGEVASTIGKDAAAVLESQARKIGRDDLADAMSTNTRAGLSARTQYMRDTGEIVTPGFSGDMTVSPKAILDNHAARPTAERDNINKALQTLDELDDARLGHRPMPSPQDVHWARQVVAHPSNAATVTAVREASSMMLDMAEAAGRITAVQKADLKAKRPNYIHRIPTEDVVVENGIARPRTMSEQINNIILNKGATYDVAGAPTDLMNLKARGTKSGEVQIADPVLSTMKAFEDTIQFSFYNDLRVNTLRALEADPVYGKTVNVRAAGDTLPQGRGNVTTWEGGKEVLWEVEASVADALRFAPYKTNMMLSTPKKVFQFMTTGIGAPWFVAGTNLVYDGTALAVMREKGTSASYLDRALRTATAYTLGPQNAFGLRGDLLGAFAGMSASVFRAQRADNINRLANNVEKLILSNPQATVGDAVDAFGDGFIKRLSRGVAIGHNTTLNGMVDDLRRTYAGTSKAWGMREGALHSGMGETLRDVLDNRSKEMLKVFTREYGPMYGLPLWHEHYKPLLENLYDASRLLYIDLNKGTVPAEHLARETRDLTGDLAKRGSFDNRSGYSLAEDTKAASAIAMKGVNNPVTTSVLEATPFSTAIIQGMDRLVKSAYKDPAGFSMGVVNGVMMPTVALSLVPAIGLGQQYVDYLYNGREEWKKASRIYVPIPGLPPERGLEIPVLQELSLFSYPVLEALDGLFNLSGNQGKPENASFTDAVKMALVQTFNWPLPIQAQIGLASVGINKRGWLDDSIPRFGQKVTGTGEGFHTSSMLNVGMEGVLQSLFGTVGSMGIASLDAGGSAWKNNTRSPTEAFAHQFGYEFKNRLPLLGDYKFNESGTTLAEKSREKLKAAFKIIKMQKAIDKEGVARKSAVDEATITSKGTAKKNEIVTEMPNIQQGYPGIKPTNPEFAKAGPVLAKIFGTSGDLGKLRTENGMVSDLIAGVRGVNAGNLRTMRVVPLKEPRAGLDYIIVHDGVFKSAKVPPQLKAIIGDTDVKTLEHPTLGQRQDVLNKLNKYKYTLDQRLLERITSMEKEHGFDVIKAAKMFELEEDPGAVADY